jgi:YggT family protein
MLNQALQFLIETLLGLFVLAVLIRFYLQWARVPFRNPVSQFIAALTDFAVKPLRRVIPGLFGLDLASLVLAWVVEYVMLLALFWLGGLFLLKAGPSVFIATGFLAAIKLLKISIYILLGSVFIQAILSWTNPHTPLAPVLSRLTDPFLLPLRRVVPLIANVDLSPLLLFIICELLLMVPLAWLESLAMQFA